MVYDDNTQMYQYHTPLPRDYGRVHNGNDLCNDIHGHGAHDDVRVLHGHDSGILRHFRGNGIHGLPRGDGGIHNLGHHNAHGCGGDDVVLRGCGDDARDGDVRAYVQ